MDSKQIKSLLFVIGLVAFHLFFWQESLGLNCFLFGLFSVILLYYNFAEARRALGFQVSAVGTALLGFLVMWHHSDFAIVMFLLSWLLMIGMAMAPQQPRVLQSLGQGFMNTLFAGTDLRQKIDLRFAKSTTTDDDFVPDKLQGFRPGLLIIPLITLVVFVLLYSIANQDFYNILEKFFDNIWRSLSWITDLLSFQWLFFILLAMFPIGALLWNNYRSDFLHKQNKNYLENMTATTHNQEINDKYWIAFLTLIMLNALILFFNIQEFSNIVGQGDDASASAMRQSVHLGTYVLIISILVAMGLLFYFFKDVLNFIEKAPTLRLLAYFWITQNMIMVVGVALRNYQYISNYGLAYKRVGVIFFLLLTFFGLITMLLKIKDLRTFSNIVMLNGWSAYLAAIVIACINWDIVITQFNLTHTDPKRLDVRFLVEDISDKNLYLLYDYKSNLPSTTSESYLWGFLQNTYNVDELLNTKKYNYNKRMANRGGIMSWNNADEANRRFINDSK